MVYTSWPVNVNRRIIDSTNVTVGEGAVITEQIEGSPNNRRRMLCANPPDKYSVTMHFNCYDKDESGLTEKDRFFNWYKGIHKYGTVPFEFPSILFNSNLKESYDTEEVARGKIPFYEKYIITSAVSGQKHGFDVEVTMTWETFATGIYEVPYTKSVVDAIEFHNGYAIVSLANVGKTVPITENFSVEMDDVACKYGVYSNETDSTFVYVIYPKITDDNSHTVKITLSNLTSEEGWTSKSGTVTKES